MYIQNPIKRVVTFVQHPTQNLLGIKISLPILLSASLGIAIAEKIGLRETYEKVVRYFFLAFFFFGISIIGCVAMIRKEFAQGLKIYTGKPAFVMALILFLASLSFSCYWIGKLLHLLITY